MTYEETVLRLMRLMYVAHEDRWLDLSQALYNLTGDWLRRVEERFAGVNSGGPKASILQSYTSLDQHASKIGHRHPPQESGRCASLSLNVAVVVSAGIGGLAAAHKLAHAGHRIILPMWARGSKSRPTRRDYCSAGASALRAHAVEPTGIVFGDTTWACTWATRAGACT